MKDKMILSQNQTVQKQNNNFIEFLPTKNSCALSESNLRDGALFQYKQAPLDSKESQNINLQSYLQFLLIIRFAFENSQQKPFMSNRDKRGEIILQGQGTEFRDQLAFYQGVNLIGRNPAKTTITIKDRSISQIHGKIICKNGKIKVIDAKSKNGIYLNSLQNPIDPEIEVQIDPKKDIIYFAQIKCKFILDEKPKQNQQETKQIAIKDVNKINKNSKNQPKTIDQKTQKQKQPETKNDKKVQPITKEKNQSIALNNKNKNKDNVQTKKQEVGKKKQNQQLLKAMIDQQAEKDEPSKEQTNLESKQENKIKQKSKQKQPVQKKKQKKQSKQKQKKKSTEKQQQARVAKNNSKEKKAAEQKKSKNAEKKEKQLPAEKDKNKKKEENITQDNRKQQKKDQEGREVDNKKQKEKRADSEETKIKGKQKKNKSVGKLDQPPRQEGRKKAVQQLNQSFASHSRRSILQKTALISGFTMAFKPTVRINIVESWKQKFDVLVMEKYTRTFKLLYAICMGVPIVSINWILQCQHRRGIVPFERFYLPCPQKELICNSVAAAKAGNKVFKNQKFYLIQCSQQSFHLPLEQIQALIEIGGGTVIKKISKKQDNMKNIIFIVKNKYGNEELKSVKKFDGAEKIYTVEMICDSCFNQSINWDINKVQK